MCRRRGGGGTRRGRGSALGRLALLGGPLADRRLHDLAAAQAAGADPDVLDTAVDERTHALEVGLPGARRHIMRVSDIAAENGRLAAGFTLLGHDGRSPRFDVLTPQRAG